MPKELRNRAWRKIEGCRFFLTIAKKGRYAAQYLNEAITRHATYFKTFLSTCLDHMQSFVKIGGTVFEKNSNMIQRDIHLLLLGCVPQICINNPLRHSNVPSSLDIKHCMYVNVGRHFVISCLSKRYWKLHFIIFCFFCI